MAIVISGVNNNDKITASDGTIDLLSGVSYAGIITAPAFTTPGNLTAGHLNIGSGIQLGNAGVATATTFVGNLTGNVNATSNLLLQIGGSEKFRVGSSGQLGIGGANYGTSGQVLTSQGSGSAATWSTITGTTINNNANNRLITGSGTANTLEGEANLQWDGETLYINRSSNSVEGLSISNSNNSQGSAAAQLNLSGGDNSYSNIRLECNSTSHHIRQDGSGNLKFYNDTNERFRIDSVGSIGQGTGTPRTPDGSNADNPLNGDGTNGNPVFTIYGDSPAINLVSSTTASGDYSLINFGRAGSSSNPYRAVIGYKQSDDILRINSNNIITFDTGGNINTGERLRITSDGILQAKSLSGSYYPIASVKDGSTSARAATSAWEIKKTLGPRAKTGYYYLKNPYDSSVNTWWCDMDTDGGGWILIAHVGDGGMSALNTSDGNHWYNRSNKGGFDTVGSGYYKGGGYWRTSGGAWAENTCGQLMWDVRTHGVGYNDSSVSKVVFNWGTDQALPTGGSALSNIPNSSNRRFNEWCYEVVGAPGFNPANYHQNQRSNVINGMEHFTEHMVMTFCFRNTSGAGDAGSDGPYWMIGSHHDGLHQHYEESLSGSDGVYGDGGYQVVSNEDTGWGGGASNGGYQRIGRHTDTGTCNIWLR